MIRSLLWNVLRSFYLISNGPRAFFFSLQLRYPERSQAKTLKRILKQFQIKNLSLKAFQESFPILKDQALTQALRRIQGSQIVGYEQTSGSSGLSKKIPYTQPLLNTFHAMFRLWAYDILKNVDLRTGKFFFSISPQTTATDFQEDSDYLQRSLQWLLKPFMAVDAMKIRRASTPETFMNNLAFELLKVRDLEIVSIWSPSYLLALLEEIQRDRTQFAKRSQVPIPTQAALRKQPIVWEEIWPNIKFISCWGSGMAEHSFFELKSAFPNVYLQKKGLLSTEAPLTIPWTKSQGFVPLVDQIFFEFMDLQNQVFLLHELEIGKIYEVLITTPGGLFRYRIGDLVRVTHQFHRTPCFDFLGRTSDVCDLVGEKLSESNLRQTLEPFAQDLGFYLVVPDQKNRKYILFSERVPSHWNSEQLDKALQNIFHYHVARTNQQLLPLEQKTVQDIRPLYFDYMESKGMKRGNIKEKALIPDLNALAYFETSSSNGPEPFEPSNQLNAL